MSAIGAQRIPPVRSTALTWMAAALGYAGTIVYLSWPLVTDLDRALVDPRSLGRAGGVWGRLDLELLVWIVSWTAHAIATQPLELFQANILYPAPDTLALSEHLIGLTPISAPVFWLSGNGLLTYNVTTLLVAWIGALCTFGLARAWSGNAAAAFLAGILFALSPRIADTWVRLHVSSVHFFPLVLLVAWRAASAPIARRLMLLAVITALQLAAGVYVAFELVAALVAFAPAVLIEARRHLRSGIAPLLAMAAGALVLIPIALPYLRVRASGGLPDLAQSIATIRLTSPPPIAVAAWLVEDLGWTVIALALIGLVLGRMAPWHARGGLLLIFLLGFLLSAGSTIPVLPGTSLYELAMRWIPGFAGMRAPDRFMVLPLLSLSVLAAIGAASVAQAVARVSPALGARAAAAAILAGCVALIHVRAPAEPLPLARYPLDGAQTVVHRWLRDHHETGVVLELPAMNSTMDHDHVRATGEYMLASTLHWLPLINGYSGHRPESTRLLMTLAQRLPDPQALETLCELTGLRWILAHFRWMPDQERIWTAAEETLPIEPVLRLGREVIYRVDRLCGEKQDALVRQVRGELPDQTLGGVPIAPLPPEAQRASLRAGMPAEYPPALSAWVWVDVTNRSETQWPGLAAVADGTVHLQSRWRNRETGKIELEGATVPLARDLAPGETVHAQVHLVTPGPGDYTLEIGVLQKGLGWFADRPGGEGLVRRPVTVKPLGGSPPQTPAPVADSEAG